MRQAGILLVVGAAGLLAAALWLRPGDEPRTPAKAAATPAPAPAAAQAAVPEPAAPAAPPALPAGAAPATTPSAVAAPADPVANAPDVIRVLLVPRRETTVVSEIVARITYIPTTLGATVRAGEPLVRFDCSEQKAKLDMAAAEMESARENHAAKLRLQGLQSAGELEVTLAAAARDRARGALDLAETQWKACTIAAPFAGRVVKLQAKPHQSVTVGQTLLEFVAADAPKLKLNVPSRWLRWLKPGSAFRLEVEETGRRYGATVSAINGRVDAVSQSVELEGEVTDPDPKLLAGMSGTAQFPEAKTP